MAFLARYDESRVMLPIFEIFFTSIESVVGGYFEKQTKMYQRKMRSTQFRECRKVLIAILGAEILPPFFFQLRRWRYDSFVGTHSAIYQNRRAQNKISYRLLTLNLASFSFFFLTEKFFGASTSAQTTRCPNSRTSRKSSNLGTMDHHY